MPNHFKLGLLAYPTEVSEVNANLKQIHYFGEGNIHANSFGKINKVSIQFHMTIPRNIIMKICIIMLECHINAQSIIHVINKRDALYSCTAF